MFCCKHQFSHLVHIQTYYSWISKNLYLSGLAPMQTQGASKQINTVLGLCTHFTLIYKFLHRGWTTRYVADKTLRGHYVLEYRKHF